MENTIYSIFYLKDINTKRYNNKINSEEEFQQIILDSLDQLSSEKFWREDVKIKIKDRFPGCLTLSEESSKFDIRKSLSLGFQLFR